MSRKLAKIKIISNILPIENADAIELINFDDCSWQCVAKKNEFKIGDKCIYFEIDSLLPNLNPVFDFLSKGNTVKTINFEGVEYTGYRLRTVKLRGELSQGLALPLSSFPEIDYTNEDIDGQLKIIKYDAVQFTTGNEIGNFHEHIPKTDEERVQNLTAKFDLWQDIEMVATEKLDGTSCTVSFENGIKRIFGRQYELPIGLGDAYDLATKNITILDNYSVQGEVIGKVIGTPVQGDLYKQEGIYFYAFNVFNILTHSYLPHEEFIQFCKSYDFETVPVIWEGKLSEFKDIKNLLLFAEGKSQLCSTAEREGLVFRSKSFEKNKRISFKVISNKFLLKSKD